MIFNKKKTSFPKEKLSTKAVDHFVELYSDKNPISKGAISYTTENGQTIYFLPQKALQHPVSVEHFKYLLGQTVPYHRPHIPENSFFHLQDILFIVDSNKQIKPWMKNKMNAAKFIEIGQSLSLLPSLDRKVNEHLVYLRLPDIKPVIHEEKDRGERAD